MGDGTRSSLGLPRGGALLGGLALVALLASGCARFATGPSPSGLVSASWSQASSTPTETSGEEPLPLPEGGQNLLAVLDPEVVRPGISATEAIALAREVGRSWVGESPRIQLVRLAFDDPGTSFSPIWTGWIILSTDLRWQGGIGPYPDSPAPMPTFAATYTWVYVTVDGEVLEQVQVAYDTVESVPSLPPEPAN